MHLQSYLFLPAILLAQSSFAYNCCFEIQTLHDGSLSKIINSGDGKVAYWTPRPDCKIVINRKGPSCATWEGHLDEGNSCLVLWPVGHIGVRDGRNCGHD
ncbi:hypothetical protein EG327_009884 [Venturia inaequalis]|uniref:Uncharacterized protein n=1 Tax=Venturia inaequalis TaxID=5025 RepID=A0A8H3VQH3_VENIN|nr:hypothetical protein EG327_009884 [Venturia inaequalis]